MLYHIDIRNFALIEKLSMDPGQGLLILTGETGAGKSILIDAIGSLSGSRVSKDLIRHGCDSALVEALFRVDKARIPDDILELFYQSEDDDGSGEVDIVLSREIQINGRSFCRINGRMTTLSNIKMLSSCLFDIHGQHDQQAIFQESTHLQFLDRFAGQAVQAGKDRYLEQLIRYKACQKALKELGNNPAERARAIDVLTYQIKEIEAADIKPGEETTLTERQRLLAHAEKIQEALSESYERLSGDDAGSILYEIGSVLSSLASISRHARQIDEIAASITDALDTLQTASAEIRACSDSLDIEPAELDQINNRLDLIYRLKKKYGGSLEAVLVFLNQARQQLDRLTGGEARYEALMREKEKLKTILVEAAHDLSVERQNAARRLEGLIATQLADLGMKTVRFAVQMALRSESSEHFDEQGLDRIVFELSANLGEPLKPLAQIASGGEASRIMLAIKTILADADPIPVLIFDEIDTGISGETAGQVGQKLIQLSKNRQVLCITHMAQIASMADEHWLIEKTTQSGRTKTIVQHLTDEQRSAELARLLSGGVGDRTARTLAGQLCEQAEQFKQSLNPDNPGQSACPAEPVPSR